MARSAISKNTLVFGLGIQLGRQLGRQNVVFLKTKYRYWVYSWVDKNTSKKCVKMGDKRINAPIIVRKMRLYVGDLPPKYIYLHIYNILNRSYLREWAAV